MWKFLNNVSPPPPKKSKQSDEEKQSYQKLYEKDKRSRNFQNSWKKDFKWLVYDEAKHVITCQTCVQYETVGTFVTGCSNLKLQAIKKHDVSECHIKHSLKEKAKNIDIGCSTAEKSMQSLNQAAFTKLTFLFRNAHYIAKSGRPFTDFVTLCQLDKAKGIDIGSTYLTDKYCQIFVKAIADSRRQDQNECIRSSSYISLISDGSTDTSSQEAEIVMLRTSYRCQTSTFFIGLKNVAKADAENICGAVSNLMSDRFDDTWKSKVVAMGCDGASVMLGKKKGVVQRLREKLERPFIYAIHCSAHRLELAYKDAMKKLQGNTHQRCETLLLNLYLFYKYSSLNRANLMASYKSLGLTPKVPTRVGGTRWLPHTRLALKNLLHGYDAIVQHLEQIQNPSDPAHLKDSAAKGKNFLRLLRDPLVRFWMHFLLDIVVVMSMASETMQEKDATLADVWNELESMKSMLEKYKKSDGPTLKKLNQDGDGVLDRSRQSFLNDIILAVSSRFDGDLHLFKGSSFLKFSNWPTELTEELADFEDENISDLVAVCAPALKACDPEMDTDSIEPEWTRLKTELYNSKTKIHLLTWASLYDSHAAKYPNLLCLVTYLLSLPSSSVDAERGFSRMKMIKNDWRSNLSDRNLSDLILINLEVPPVPEYDPTKAIHHWNSSSVRVRRPFYNDQKKTANISGMGQPPTFSVSEESEIPDVHAEADNNHDVFLMAEALECSGEEVEEEDDEQFLRDRALLQQRAYKMLLNVL